MNELSIVVQLEMFLFSLPSFKLFSVRNKFTKNNEMANEARYALGVCWNVHRSRLVEVFNPIIHSMLSLLCTFSVVWYVIRVSKSVKQRGKVECN